MRYFWKIYGLAYDALNSFAPYVELLDEAIWHADIEPGKAYLDVGCGTGNLLEKLKTKEVTIVGMDSSPSMLSIARKKIRKNQEIRLEFGDLNKTLQFKSKIFDGIFCITVLAYVRNPEFTLKELSRILKPQGKLILSTPKNGFNILRLLQEHVRTKGLFYNFYKLYPSLIFLAIMNMRFYYGTMRGYVHFLREKELEEMIKSASMEIVTRKKSYGGQSILIVAKKSYGA